MTPRPNQLLPTPSMTVTHSTNKPIIRVRFSPHAASELRRPAVRPAGPACMLLGRKRRAAAGSVTATASATASRCAGTGTRQAIMRVPRPAPATVPTLQPAWNRGMIDRPRRRSTAAPCTLIATSPAAVPKPRTNSPAATGATPRS